MKTPQEILIDFMITQPVMDDNHIMYVKSDSAIDAMEIYAHQFYTQEQMLAFGERVKEKCASDAEITYDFGIEEVDKQSILSIDISKLLNK